MARAAFTISRRRQTLAAEIERLGPKSPINQIRKAVFDPVDVREKGRLKKRAIIPFAHTP